MRSRRPGPFSASPGGLTFDPSAPIPLASVAGVDAAALAELEPADSEGGTTEPKSSTTGREAAAETAADASGFELDAFAPELLADPPCDAWAEPEPGAAGGGAAGVDAPPEGIEA